MILELGSGRHKGDCPRRQFHGTRTMNSEYSAFLGTVSDNGERSVVANRLFIGPRIYDPPEPSDSVSSSSAEARPRGVSRCRSLIKFSRVFLCAAHTLPEETARNPVRDLLHPRGSRGHRFTLRPMVSFRSRIGLPQQFRDSTSQPTRNPAAERFPGHGYSEKTGKAVSRFPRYSVEIIITRRRNILTPRRFFRNRACQKYFVVFDFIGNDLLLCRDCCLRCIRTGD